MPTFDFTAPDGKQYSVDGPEGSTPEQAFAILGQQLGQPAPKPPLPSEIGSDILNTVTSALSPLNPFSEERHASYARQAAAPLGQAIGENLSQVAGVGSGLGQTALLPISTPGAAIVPPLARTLDVINNAAGFNVPYEKAKEDMATALMGLRPKAASPRGIETTRAPAPTNEELHTAYTDYVKDPNVVNTQVPASEVRNFRAKIENDLVNDPAQGFRPTDAPGTFGIIKDMTPPGPSASVGDLLAIRRSLGHQAGEVQANGKATPDAAAAVRVKTELDNFIERFAPGLKEANQNERAANLGQQMDFRGRKAEFKTNDSNSGMNLENNLRKQITQIIGNPKLRRGYTAEQLKAMEQFNRGSRTANVLRMVGNALGGGGGWMSVVNAIVGNAIAGPLGGIAEPATGLAIKAAGNARARQQFNLLADMMRQHSPLARSLPPVPVPLPGPVGGVLGPQFAGLPLRFGMMPARADEQ